MAKIIGIDLGTTYSAVSYWDEKKQAPVIIPNLQGANTTPSVVSLNDAGEVMVGEDAKQNYTFNPDNTIWQIKREMGRDFMVTMGGKSYNPQTISAFILRYMKIYAEKYLGEPIYDAVITVPAYFNEVQHSATRDAGIIAGLNVHRLINEPTSAAIAYGMKSGLGTGENKVYAVYDLGGGTFDVSIIEISAEDITVVGTGGDPRLGGLDMDEEMMKWTLRQIKAKQDVDLGGDEAVKRRLRLEVEGVKKRLVMSESTELHVPFLTTIGGKPFNLKLSITRSQYEGLIEKLLNRSMDCLDSAVESASAKNGIGWEKLDGVLLVGGPTRLPIIRQKLDQKFREKMAEHGCPDRPYEIRGDQNPDEVVAMGAAIVAASLVPIGKAPEEIAEMSKDELDKLKEKNRGEQPTAAPEMNVYDVTGHSLGIAVEGVNFCRIIDKESVIPVKQSKAGFSNAADFTTELLVEVYQGEEDFVAANTKIGEVKITGLDPLPKGSHILEVEFNLDVSGTLSTICTDLRTKKAYEGSFKFDTVRMSKEEIDKKRQMVADVLAYKNTEAKSAVPPDSGPQENMDSYARIPLQDIPNDWKGYWQKGLAAIAAAQGENRRKIGAAMGEFYEAAKGGNPDSIEAKGYVLQDTILEVVG